MAATYTRWTAYVNSKSIVLHVLSSAASNITLKKINGNVADQSSIGINGCFYDLSSPYDLLSIAAQNDYVLNPSGTYGGRYNIGAGGIDAPKGTLVYDGFDNSCSIQKISDYKKVSVSKRYNYWAQGGISMSLNDDAGWATTANSEGIANPTGSVHRTGLAYSGTTVFGIVSDTNCTAADFRAAIKATFSFSGAIFLDSGPSSQMKAIDNTGRDVLIRGGNSPQEMLVFG